MYWEDEKEASCKTRKPASDEPEDDEIAIKDQETF